MNNHELPTMQSLWQSYWQAISPVNPSGVQREETRKAFYAGAFVMMTTMELLAGPGVDDELAGKYLECLKRDCLVFATEVGEQGRSFPMGCIREYEDGRRTLEVFMATAEQAAARQTRAMGEPKVKSARTFKIGRNDVCPCGSGRKFKHCCIGKLGTGQHELK